MLEVGIALFLIIFIVWWTMFADQTPHQTQDDAPPKDKEQ